MSSYQSGSVVSELWLHWFSCCINEQTQSNKKRARRRIRIDRTMIGLPTDFQHTAHIGSSDIELNNSAVIALQNQMQSKGGYETSYTALKDESRGQVINLRKGKKREKGERKDKIFAYAPEMSL